MHEDAARERCEDVLKDPVLSLPPRLIFLLLFLLPPLSLFRQDSRRQVLGISRLLVTSVLSVQRERKPTVTIAKSRSLLTVVKMTLDWLGLCRLAVLAP